LTRLSKKSLPASFFNSLEQADSINHEVKKRIALGPVQAELELAPEGVTIN